MFCSYFVEENAQLIGEDEKKKVRSPEMRSMLLFRIRMTHPV